MKEEKPVYCPVCLEKGDKVPMVKGRPTTFYFYYKCPACGNMALVERESE